MASQHKFKFKRAYTVDELMSVLNGSNLTYGVLNKAINPIGKVPVLYFPTISEKDAQCASLMMYPAKKDAQGNFLPTDTYYFNKDGYTPTGDHLAKGMAVGAAYGALGFLGNILYMFDPDKKKKKELFELTIKEIERLGL